MATLQGILEIQREGKTDADLIYMFWKETEQLKIVIEEQRRCIKELKERENRLVDFMEQEECHRAKYGNPEETLIYAKDVKNVVFKKTWVNKKAEEIFKKRQEEKNEPDRSPENDKGSAAE